MGDEFIGFRIVFVVVNAVDNTSEIAASCTHQAIQPFSVEGGLDFFRISIAYGGYRVRIDKAAFEKVGILVGLQLIRGEEGHG